MTTAAALDWFRQMLWTATLACAPSVLAIVIVGLVMAILQAATQVNDQTVAFAPKAIAMVVALVLGGPFMMSELTKFTNAVFAAVARM
ncbi:MAG TPA: flagellar biosynthetic protein FliQ [Polyangiales bacterium]|nr:flagellar biosynthetic protein FliQ [Polyangiales bacterium]